ncbi:MAG: AbrB/MazE/SpoVT family DNA-binding domain-containing protein [Clostridia bacterium]|nr:AbrB/MazE/SpoVT family DNA-binding domain-containing protein [Clostridia bacterium]
MAKSGYIREIDRLGRVVIPKQYRKEMNISEEGGEVLLTCKNGVVTVSKSAEVCVFCRSRRKLSEFKDKPVCAKCLNEIKYGSEEELSEEAAGTAVTAE